MASTVAVKFASRMRGVVVAIEQEFAASASKHGVGWPSLNDAERAVLRELLISGPRSRAELARRLGVSRASLTRVTRELRELDLVVEGDTELRGATGRPSELLLVRPEARRFLGVKLTGDAVFVVVTDLGAGILVSADEALVSHDVDEVAEQIAALRTRLVAETGDVVAAGVTVAGDQVRRDGHTIIADSPFLGWHDLPLADILGARLGVPVAVDNDVRALAAAEHWFGAGAGCESLAVVTVGAGVGLGFVTDRHVVRGRNGRAGRLDHLIVDSAGPVCGLGHRGCVSAFLTSSSILNAYGVVGADYDGVVDAARRGDARAVRVFADAGRALGTVVAAVVNLLDPEKIVLTGDGLAVMEFATEVVQQSATSLLVSAPGPIELDVQPFEFSEWARGGAVAAIRMTVDF